MGLQKYQRLYKGVMDVHLGIWTAPSCAELSETHVILIAGIHLITFAQLQHQSWSQHI